MQVPLERTAAATCGTQGARVALLSLHAQRQRQPAPAGASTLPQVPPPLCTGPLQAGQRIFYRSCRTLANSSPPTHSMAAYAPRPPVISCSCKPVRSGVLPMPNRVLALAGSSRSYKCAATVGAAGLGPNGTRLHPLHQALALLAHNHLVRPASVGAGDGSSGLCLPLKQAHHLARQGTPAPVGAEYNTPPPAAHASWGTPAHSPKGLKLISHLLAPHHVDGPDAAVLGQLRGWQGGGSGEQLQGHKEGAGSWSQPEARSPQPPQLSSLPHHPPEALIPLRPPPSRSPPG